MDPDDPLRHPRQIRIAIIQTASAGLANGFSGGVGRPVIDRTGLSGTFDVEMSYLIESPPLPGLARRAGPPPEGVSLRDAIKQQLGFELRPERNRVEFLVIDAIERPTPD